MKRFFCAVLLVAAAACSQPPEPRSRAKLRIAAAADLNAALGELVARFTASHPIDVTVTYGSSGTFYAQLVNDAPFDLFFSADVEYPRRLAAQGKTLADSEFQYAVGRLVLWVPKGSPIDPARDGLNALASRTVAHVAIANPDHAPYGRAAVAALQAEQVYDAVRHKIVFGENVAQALQFVQSGAADAGIVALSLALAPASRDAGRYAEVPLGEYPRIDQGGAILRWAADVESARAFRAFVIGADGRAILRQFGFSMPAD
ncbi:MAG TPA: molybdate ABC transporter substrate-binding protein [Vicinamibacterales bacterium]|nr:molybdate ABC transporter substrate-binding protein [Vicinamibacterales bacterium]